MDNENGKRKRSTRGTQERRYGKEGRSKAGKTAARIERTGIGRKAKREGAECAARTMREILSEDGREIGWLKEMWKRRERMENGRSRG
jgi:hypothetical protein